MRLAVPSFHPSLPPFFHVRCPWGHRARRLAFAGSSRLRAWLGSATLTSSLPQSSGGWQDGMGRCAPVPIKICSYMDTGRKDCVLWG